MVKGKAVGLAIAAVANEARPIAENRLALEVYVRKEIALKGAIECYEQTVLAGLHFRKPFKK